LTAANYTYAVFGLFIQSNLQIPWLSAVLLPARGPDVRVRLEVSPISSGAILSGPEELCFSSSYKDEAGDSALRIWKLAGGDFLRLTYFDGTEFWLDRQGTEVWALWPASLTIEDATTYLLGPVLGLLLRLRGVTCLHASAVAMGEHVVAIVGSEGAGKSTTAATLALRGHAILSDDVVTLTELNGSFYVHPACPYLCLWPESVESIYGSADALPRFSANYDKRCLSLRKQELRFEERALPLAAIYILGQRRGDPAPLVQELAPQEAFFLLVSNTFATRILDTGMRAKEFETLGRLVPSMTIRQLHAHHDASRLPALCEKICSDVEAISLRKAGRA
jgi:hypothetical protein